MSSVAMSPATTLGAKPALPFTLATAVPTQDEDVIDAIFSRLERLQQMAIESQLELRGLRQLNAEILEAVGRQSAVTDPGPVSMSPRNGAPASTSLSLRLLGAFEAWVGDSVVTDWPGRKARLLLAYLAMERGRMVPKDVLIELFWPEARADRGANNLSIAIHHIRSTLSAVSPEASRAVTVKQGLYGIDPARADVDLWHLQANLDHARHALERRDKDAVQTHLLNALALWRGELLASDPYEEWAAEPRRMLNVSCHKALNWLATEASVQADWSGVLDYAGRMLRNDACDEAAHRLLIDAHMRMGNRSQALQQYQACLAVLRDELGVRPSQETLDLAKTLGG